MRLKKSKNRPILGKEKTDGSIKKIYFIRKKFYNKADYRIKCKTLTLKQIIEKIFNFYEKSNRKNNINGKKPYFNGYDGCG